MEGAQKMVFFPSGPTHPSSFCPPSARRERQSATGDIKFIELDMTSFPEFKNGSTFSGSTILR
jgi:hypothetical protein